MLRYMFLVVICFGIVNYTHAKKKFNWSIPEGKITHVFEYALKKDQVEIIRLYSSGEYEYLNYITQKNKPEIVKRNLGSYELTKHKLTLFKPEFNEFQGVIKFEQDYYLNNDLYKRRLDCLFKSKNTFFKKQTKKSYKKPFYFCLNSDVIVNNDSIQNALNLNDLVNYVVTGISDEREKVLALTKFICNSIEYDYYGLQHGKYAHSQCDIYGILMSRQRLAVCAGYAYVFDSLAKIAKIDSREVSGYTKQSYNDYGKLSNLHAWNIVKIAGKEYNIDVTWADSKYGIEMKWMFVEPEVMILSHYPLDVKDNLYNKQFTASNFKDREVVLPQKENTKLKHYPMNGLYKINTDVLTLKFKTNVNVKAYWVDNEILETVYTGESNRAGTNYYTLHKIEDLKTYSKNDTFYVEVPIKNVKTALDIDVSNEYTIKLQVFKGDETTYFVNKLNEWNNQHVAAFTEGILAAIKLGETEFLKEKLGEQYSILFDKKDRWKLNKEIYNDILHWDGSTQGLTVVKTISISKETKKYEEQYINFNLKDRFYVKKENNKYIFVRIR